MNLNLKWQLHDAVTAVLVGLAYFAAARAGTALHLPQSHIAIAWPAAGVALGALVVASRNTWPLLITAIAVANVTANLAVGESAVTAIGVTLADLLEAAVGAWIILRWDGPDLSRASLRRVGAIAAAAAFVSPLTALVGALFSTASSGTPFWASWRQFWVVDAVGIVTIAPAIMALRFISKKTLAQARPRQWAELLALLVAAAMAAGLVGAADSNGLVRVWSARYLVFPFLAWGAIRFGTPGAALVAIVTAVTATVADIASSHVLEADAATTAVLSLQVFLCTSTLSAAGLAAYEAERHRLEEQLRRAQRLEALGLLASGVAHDFNNMLTVILAQGKLLERSLEPGPAKRVRVIQEAGVRAARLTQQLLVFSRRQPVHPVVTKLNDYVRQTEDMLKRLARENVEVKLDLTDAPTFTQVDPTQVDQILINLVANACDAMPAGGKLTIGTTVRHLGPGDPNLPAGSPSGAYVVLSVRDSGTGIDEETLGRLFEPFFSTKPPGRGTGLGLATVQAAAQKSKGFVSVDTKISRGTTMSVYLPAIAEPAPAPVRAVIKPEPTGRRESILLVEDEPEVRAVLTDALSQANYEVVAVGLPSAALAHCATHAPDLVISDGIMPEMNGAELVSRLMRTRPDLKALLISGYPDLDFMRECPDDGRLFHLQKPFDTDALANKVASILR